MLEQFDSNVGSRQGCTISPSLLTIFIDVLRKLDESNIHPPVMLKEQI
jgi:hypothetical protein